MSEFEFDLGGLSPWLRHELVRHLEQTHHTNFEPSGHPVGLCVKPGCPWNSLPAQVLRSLTEAVKAGGPVRLRLGSLSKGDRYRVSELLAQTAARPFRDGDEALGRVLGALWQQLDKQLRLSGDGYERAEHLRYDAARRERQLAEAEAKRLRRKPDALDGVLESMSMHGVVG